MTYLRYVLDWKLYETMQPRSQYAKCIQSNPEAHGLS